MKNKTKKKIIPFILCLVFALSSLATFAVAAENNSGTSNGVSAWIETDKSSYSSDEDIKIAVSAKNETASPVSGIHISVNLPDTLAKKNGDFSKTFDVIQAGETFCMNSVAMNNTSAAGTDENNKNDAGSPQTGDESATLLLICFVIMCLSGGTLLTMLCKKHKKQVLSLVLCLSMLLTAGILNPIATLAASNDVDISISKTITVDGKEVSIGAEITSGNNSNVTVSFETNGGKALEPITLEKGGTLDEMPSTSKESVFFTGWFTDKELTSQFYIGEPIENDITLYASYQEPETNFQQYNPTEYYLDDQSSDFKFTLISDTPLTNENLSQYVSVVSTIGDVPALTVSVDSEGYVVSPVSPYTAGAMYEISLLGQIRFADSTTSDCILTDVTLLRVNIYKEETAVVNYSSSLVEFSAENIIKNEGSSFIIEKKNIGSLAAGNVINIAASDEEARYVTIQSVVDTNGSYCRVTFIDSNLNDVYDSVDINLKNIDVSDKIINDSIDTKAIEKSLYGSAVVNQVTYMMASLLAASPTVNEYSEQLPNFTAEDLAAFSNNATVYDGKSIAIDGLLDGLTITAAAGEATNKNFDRCFQNPQSKKWSYLSIKFEYETTLKNAVKIKATIEVIEYLHIDMLANTKKDSSISNFKFSYKYMTYSQTDLNFTVLVCSAKDDEQDKEDKEDKKTENKDDEDDDDKFKDISVEIADLSESQDDDDSKGIIGEMQEMLENDGSPIELCSVPLVNVDVPVLTVISVNFGLDFVVNIDFAAALKADTTFLSARCTYFQGNTKTNTINSCNYDLYGDGRYSFDLFACGYIGVKAGFEGSIALSFTGLSSLGKIGINLEVGAYADLYGFVHYELLNKRIVPEAVFEYKSSRVSGGAYMEFGIYINIGVFAESELFNKKAEKVLFEKKFPLFSIGEKYVLTEIGIEDGSSYTMSGDCIPIDSICELKGTVMDITTGEVITGVQISDSLVLLFSKDFLNYNKENKTITFTKTNSYNYYVSSGNSQIVTLKMYVYYGGQSLIFNTGLNKYRVGELDFTYAPANLDPDKIGQEVTATFRIGSNGDYTTFEQQTYKYGDRIYNTISPLEYDDIANKYIINVNGKYLIQDSNWEKNPFMDYITEDTTYTYIAEKKQLGVYYAYYNGTDWSLDRYAVNVGDMCPSVDTFSNDKISFNNWKLLCSDGRTANGITTAELSRVRSYIEGYDTSKPIYTHTYATYDELISALNSNGGIQPDDFGLYTADYNCAQYNITYNCNGITRTKTYDYLDRPSNEVFCQSHNFSFIGWDSNGDGKVDFAPAEKLHVVTGDATYTAIFSGEDCPITVFDINGNKTTYKTKYGEAYPDALLRAPALPATASGEYYEDAHWECRASYSDHNERFNFSSGKTVEDASAYYATATHLFDVTLDPDGNYIAGGTKAITKKVVAGQFKIVNVFGASAQKTSDEKNDYVFTGWTDQNNNFYEKDATITLDHALTLKPVFVPSERTYTATVTTAHGVLLNGKATDTFKGNYDDWNAFKEKYSNYRPSDEMTESLVWTFVSYQNQFDSSALTQTITLNWNSSPRKYTVKTDYNNGTTPDQQSIEYNKSVTLPTGLTKEDNYCTYKLVGWDTNGDAMTDVQPGANITIKSDITLAAVWAEDVIKQYTITFDAGKGKFTNGKSTNTYTGTYNQAFTKTPEAPIAPDGMEFTAWAASIPSVFGGNETVSANYQYKKYKLTFRYVDPDTGKSVDYSEKTVTYNDTLTSDILPATPSAASGKLWSGWKINGGAVEGKIVDGDIIAIGVITPVYVVYTLNGVETSREQIDIGSNVTVKDQQSGYKAWATSDVTVTDGKFIMPEKDVTLDAQIDTAANLTISDGLHTDIYNASTFAAIGEKSTSGYEFDTTNGILYITADGLTVSGSANDIAIVTASTIKALTLKDFTAVTNASRNVKFDSNYYVYEDNPIDGSDPDTFNTFLLCLQNTDMTLTINGNVSLSKKCDASGNHYCILYNPREMSNIDLGGGITINVAQSLKGTMNIVGADENSALNVYGETGVKCFGQLNVKDVTLNITGKSSGINVKEIRDSEANTILGNVTFTNSKVIINADSSYECKSLFNSIYAFGNIIFNDSSVSINSRIRCECPDEYTGTGTANLYFNGKTSGEIKDLFNAGYAVNADGIVSSIDIGYTVKLSGDGGVVWLNKNNSIILNDNTVAESWIYKEDSQYYIVVEKIDETTELKTFTITG